MTQLLKKVLECLYFRASGREVPSSLLCTKNIRATKSKMAYSSQWIIDMDNELLEGKLNDLHLSHNQRDLPSLEELTACSAVKEDETISEGNINDLHLSHIPRDLVSLEELTACSAVKEDETISPAEENISEPDILTCDAAPVSSCTDAQTQNDPDDVCSLEDFVETLQLMKHEYKNKVRVCKSTARRVMEAAIKEASGTKCMIEFYEKRADEIVAEFDIIETNLKELSVFPNKVNDVKREVKNVARTLVDDYKKVTGDSASLQTLSSAIVSLAGCQSTVDKYSRTVQHTIQIIPNLQFVKNQEILELLKAGAPIYGEHVMSRGRTYAQVTFEDERLLLHCLRSDVYPNEGVAIMTRPFEFFRKMVPKKSTIIFLDVGWAGERRGRVFVQMFGSTARGRQAALLCSGEQGPSYTNTVFYDRNESHTLLLGRYEESLFGGDYENNDGSGGRAIVEGIGNNSNYNHPFRDGLMASWSAHEHWRLGSFVFYLHGEPHKNIDTAFGSVIAGLEILRAASKQVPVTSSYVCNCGLVMSSKCVQNS